RRSRIARSPSGAFGYSKAASGYASMDLEKLRFLELLEEREDIRAAGLARHVEFALERGAELAHALRPLEQLPDPLADAVQAEVAALAWVKHHQLIIHWSGQRLGSAHYDRFARQGGHTQNHAWVEHPRSPTSTDGVPAL